MNEPERVQARERRRDRRRDFEHGFEPHHAVESAERVAVDPLEGEAENARAVVDDDLFDARERAVIDRRQRRRLADHRLAPRPLARYRLVHHIAREEPHHRVFGPTRSIVDAREPVRRLDAVTQGPKQAMATEATLWVGALEEPKYREGPAIRGRHGCPRIVPQTRRFGKEVAALRAENCARAAISCEGRA